VRTALVLGEALIDEFPDRRVVAGASLHVAAHLADLGWDSRLVTRVGTDEDGDRIVATMAQLGVDISLIERDESTPTGRTTIVLDDSAHSFTVHPGAWDRVEGPDPVPPADLVVFGTLALRHPQSRAMADHLIRAAHQATVAVDLNLRAPHFDDETIRWAVQHTDILKVNEEEAAHACRAFGISDSNGNLHPEGPTWIAISRGADGADLTHADGRRWTAEAPAVEVVDTVGAGDAFLATLVDGLGRVNPDRALRAAVDAGSATVRFRGGLEEPTTAEPPS